jgi:hypothetical protein
MGPKKTLNDDLRITGRLAHFMVEARARRPSARDGASKDRLIDTVAAMVWAHLKPGEMQS